MKWIAYILSFYLVVLAILPCKDGLNSCALEEVLTQSGELMAIHSPDKVHEHQHIKHSDDANDSHEDNCSPFCICACCGISLDQINNVPLSYLETFFLQKLSSPPIHIRDSKLPYKKWRPPRLS